MRIVSKLTWELVRAAPHSSRLHRAMRGERRLAILGAPRSTHANQGVAREGAGAPYRRTLFKGFAFGSVLSAAAAALLMIAAVARIRIKSS